MGWGHSGGQRWKKEEKIMTPKMAVTIACVWRVEASFSLSLSLSLCLSLSLSLSLFPSLSPSLSVSFPLSLSLPLFPSLLSSSHPKNIPP